MHVLLLAALTLAPTFQATDGREALESWRFTLDLGPRSDAEDAPRDALPFVVEFDAHASRAWIVNGDERIGVASATRDDARWVLDFPHYDSRLDLALGDDGWSGTWTKERGRAEPASVPVTAMRSEFRFEPVDGLGLAPVTFAGRWRATFESGGEVPAVAVFEEGDRASMLRGTFLTDTGDYRYLAGDVAGGVLRLSCFDGAHAFLFEAEFAAGLGEADALVNGVFRSGDWWTERWSAVRDDEVELPDPLERVGVLESAHVEMLALPDTSGDWHPVWNLRRPAVIEVFGSWCPNCHDAAQLMQELHAEHGDELDVVGIAFELTGDWERDARQVDRFRDRHDLDYTLLVGGTADKAATAQALGLTSEILSYPTTFFVDRNGAITAVYSGFSGPVTGAAHLRLRERIELEVADLLTAPARQPRAGIISSTSTIDDPRRNGEAMFGRFDPRTRRVVESFTVSAKRDAMSLVDWTRRGVTVAPRIELIGVGSLLGRNPGAMPEPFPQPYDRFFYEHPKLYSGGDLRHCFTLDGGDWHGPLPDDRFATQLEELLLPVFREGDAEARAAVMRNVGQQGAESAPAPLDLVLDGLTDEDRWVRANAAAASAVIAAREAERHQDRLGALAAALTGATTDPAHLVRREAARALAAWGLGADLLIRWRSSESPFDRDLARAYAAVLAEGR